MKTFTRLLLALLLAFPIIGQSQTIAGYPVSAFLVSSVHPSCDMATSAVYVVGPPDDKCWVNMADNTVMTGLFGSNWTDQSGQELLLETSYHTDNYDVRLMLAGGGFSATRTVSQAEWTQITDTVWTHYFATCSEGTFGSDRFILPLDFDVDFGVTGATQVEGIEITFLNTSGAPDLAGVYIISDVCPTVNLGSDFFLCDGQDSLLTMDNALATYEWQDGSMGNSFLIDSPGTYWVTETIDDCITNDTIVVGGQSSPNVELGPDTTLCEGEFVVLDAGNFAGATYLWTGNFNSQFIAANMEGSYWVEVTVNGCVGSDTIQVDIGTGVSAALGPDTSLCEGQTLILDAGADGDSYEWQDGSNAQTFETDQAGEYWVDITTGTCVTSDTIIVDVMPYPIVDLGNDTSICNGESLILTASNPGADFEWQDSSTSSSFNASTEGWYWVDVASAQCVTRDSLLLNLHMLPTGVISSTSPFCANSTTPLEFDLTGTAPFTLSYSLDNVDQSDLNTNSLSYSIPIDEPGTYQLTNVSDANCESGMENSIVVMTFPPISSNVNAPSMVCEGDIAILTASASGGQADGYTFEWSDGQAFLSSENPLSLTLTDDLDLYLVANDECDLPSDTVSISIAVESYPDPVIAVLEDSVCIGEAVIFQQPDPDSGTTCLWTFQDGTQSSDCDQVTHSFFQSGYPSVTLTLTTAAGCAESLTLESSVYVLDDPEALFNYEKLNGTVFSPGVQFSNISNNASDYEWSFGDFTFSEEVDPYHLYPSTITDDYLACLTAYNSLGCADTTCKVVTIDPEFLVSIPNAFSPDGDNVNDYFLPVFNDIRLAEYRLLIFDRTGRIVFESVDQGKRWDGSGTIDENYFTADGVYHYTLVIREFNKPEKREFKGFVTVLR